MTGRGARLCATALALVWAGCGAEGPTSGVPPATAGLPGSCPNSALPASGSTLAFLATADDRLRTFAVDAASGCWVHMDVQPGPASPGGLALDPSGRYLYVSGRIAARRTGVQAFRIDGARGALASLGVFEMETQWWDSPGGLIATEDALYMLSGTIGPGYHGGFWSYAIDRGSGGLSWRGSPQRARDASFIALWPRYSLLYLATAILRQERPETVLALRIAPGGGLFLAGEPDVRDSSGARAVPDPGGVFLWVATGPEGEGSARLDAYQPQPDGSLRLASGVPWPRRPPAVHVSGRFLYTVSSTQVEAYAVDAASGAPQPVGTAPYAGPAVTALATDPAGQFLYVVSSDGVRAYRTGGGGHSLQELGRVAEGGRHLVLQQAR